MTSASVTKNQASCREISKNRLSLGPIAELPLPTSLSPNEHITQQTLGGRRTGPHRRADRDPDPLDSSPTRPIQKPNEAGCLFQPPRRIGTPAPPRKPPPKFLHTGFPAAPNTQRATDHPNFQINILPTQFRPTDLPQQNSRSTHLPHQFLGSPKFPDLNLLPTNIPTKVPPKQTSHTSFSVRPNSRT